MPNVYVAASFSEYERAQQVKMTLEGYGLGVTSAWIQSASEAFGHDPILAADNLNPPAEVLSTFQESAALNDSAIEHADIALVLASEGARETFAEARFAISLGKLVVWVGTPRPLSAYRLGVLRFAADDVACAFLCGYAGSLTGRKPVRTVLAPATRDAKGFGHD